MWVKCPITSSTPTGGSSLLSLTSRVFKSISAEDMLASLPAKGSNLQFLLSCACIGWEAGSWHQQDAGSWFLLANTVIFFQTSGRAWRGLLLGRQIAGRSLEADHLLQGSWAWGCGFEAVEAEVHSIGDSLQNQINNWFSCGSLPRWFQFLIAG